jgi:hypothetical protein
MEETKSNYLEIRTIIEELCVEKNKDDRDKIMITYTTNIWKYIQDID